MTAVASTKDVSLTRQALAGKRVLLTGTTGFLGKVILEKLVRAVPDIGEVLLLIRGNRKYPTAAARFRAEIATSTVFDHLRETAPDHLGTFLETKIRCVDGEITQPLFGMSKAEFAGLAAETDVFINSAASVNFREELDKALTINTFCLNEIAAFSAAGNDLPVVQISTCYVNGYNQGQILEAANAPASGLIPLARDGYHDIDPVFVDLIARMAEVEKQYADPVLRAEAMVELGQSEAHRYGWGDTYTFTKWLGEQLLLKKMKGKTVTIVRPSVIESCLQEPVQGWIEGVKVTDSILLAYARSKVTMFPGRRAGIVDIIPADLVANSVILSVAEAFLNPGEHRIYQSCSGSRNPLVVDRYIKLICGEMKENWHKYPRLTRKAPRKKFTLVNKRLFVALIQALRLAYTTVDRLSLRSSSNKSKGLKAIETTLKLTRIYSTYTSPNYIFDSSRLNDLADRFGEVDQKLFPVDAALIDWPRYFQEIHITGLNRYGMEDRAPKPEVSEENGFEATALASQG